MIRGTHPVTHLTSDQFELFLFDHPGLVGSYGGEYPEALLKGRRYVADVPTGPTVRVPTQPGVGVA